MVCLQVFRTQTTSPRFLGRKLLDFLNSVLDIPLPGLVVSDPTKGSGGVSPVKGLDF